MAEKLFINYRREDAGGHAEMLARELRKHTEIGADGVFFDAAPGVIPAGEIFSHRLGDGIARADVVFVVIGHNWLRLLNERTEENDYVRKEIEGAIALRKRIVPVLVTGASMPKAHELPPAIRELARWQAVVFPPGRFTIGYQELVSGIEPLLRDIAARRTKRDPVSHSSASAEKTPARSGYIVFGTDPRKELKGTGRPESASVLNARGLANKGVPTAELLSEQLARPQEDASKAALARELLKPGRANKDVSMSEPASKTKDGTESNPERSTERKPRRR